MKTPTAINAVAGTTDEWQAAFRPIASLISKSEKAQRKLAPGTWQHAMLRDNLQALRVASALMNKETAGADRFAPDVLQAALRALASMIGKTENAQAKFSPGTSQHTLLRNRLQALRMADASIQAALDKRRVPGKDPRMKKCRPGGGRAP